ncbi:MAG: hypothetical protein V4486_01370 [Patescibacteria group bacterium]
MQIISFILNLPYTFLGLVLALVSIPDLKMDFRAKPIAIIVHVTIFWWAFGYMKGARAMAIGNVVILGQNIEKGDLKHELVHVEQFDRNPLVQPILYFIELGRKGYRNNKYEVEAYTRAGNIYKT